MIVIHNNTAGGVFKATLVKSLADANAMPATLVGCHSTPSISVRVMTALLNAEPGSRVDLVFVDVLPDRATEEFLVSHRHDIRSIAIIGGEKYVVKSPKLDRLLMSLNLVIHDATGEGSVVNQLGAIFSDKPQIRRHFDYLKTVALQLTA